MSKEKRQHKRLEEPEVDYILDIDGDNYYGVIDNISIGGVFLRTIDHPLNKEHDGKHAKLTLIIRENNETIVIDGNIAHSTTAGVGMNFNVKDLKTRAIINSLIDAYIQVMLDTDNLEE